VLQSCNQERVIQIIGHLSNMLMLKVNDCLKVIPAPLMC
jgi:hypothetical protein